jgi:PAS domain S-box-containing protein
VAKRLDNLEAVLGYSLLKRGPRGVHMTAAGRAFYAQAQRVVRGAQGLLERDSHASDRLSGVQRLLGRGTVRSAELLLADVERLLGQVLDSVSAGIVLRRISDGVVLEANEAFCRLIETPRKELVGNRCPGLEDEENEETLASVAETGVPVRASTIFRTRSGSNRAVDVVVRRIDVAGEEAFLIVLDDVTRARETALRLARRVARQRLISRLGQMIQSDVDVDEMLVATIGAAHDELDFATVGLLDRTGKDAPELRVVVGDDHAGLLAAAERHRRTWERGEVVAESERATPGSDEPRNYVVCSPLPGRRGPSQVLVARGPRPNGLDSDDRDFLRSITTLCAAALTAAGELAA